jgi:Tfp pilus assembly protein PilN
MKRLAIDFAPHTMRRAIFQTRPLALLIGCAALAAGLWAGLSAFDLSKQIDADQAQLSRLKGKARDSAAAKPVTAAPKVSDGQANAVNNAVAQLNVPWRDVLDAVEGATPASIGLLALEPDAKRNVVRGMAEAKTSGDMIAYIEALKKQGFFDIVILTKHEVNDLDPNKPLRFQFEAQWRGEGP